MSGQIILQIEQASFVLEGIRNGLDTVELDPWRAIEPLNGLVRFASRTGRQR